MNEKLCNGCNAVKKIECFAKNSGKYDGYQTYCKPCKKQRDAAYYMGNKAKQAERNKKNRDRIRQEVAKIKQDSGCMYCPETEPCCLDFHHRDADDKFMDIAYLVGKQQVTKLREEIKKCDILCANCHRKLHHGIVLTARKL